MQKTGMREEGSYGLALQRLQPFLALGLPGF